MLRQPTNARRLNDRIVLTKAAVTVDDYGHASMGAPAEVLTVYASVRQMSATKTMMVFQQTDIVGLEIEFRAVAVEFNGITWRGHQLHFSQPESVDNRGRFLRVSAWYQNDNPLAEPAVDTITITPGEQPGRIDNDG